MGKKKGGVLKAQEGCVCPKEEILQRPKYDQNCPVLLLSTIKRLDLIRSRDAKERVGRRKVSLSGTEENQLGSKRTSTGSV